MLIASASEGKIGILPGHMPLFSRLEPGELKIIREKKETIFMALSGGFIQVKPNEITVLADTAERAESINEAKAIEARKKAKSLLKQKLSDVEFAMVEADLKRAVAQLRTVRSRKWRRQRKAPQG